MVEGKPSPGQNDPEVLGNTQVEETETPVIPKEKLDTIRENALARDKAFRIQEKLDEIRSDRAQYLKNKDRDTEGRVRNGLFGWRAIRRSFQPVADIARSPGDYAAAEKSVDENELKNVHIESLMSEAAGGFNSLSNDSARQEMNDLLSTIADRYKLDQETRTAHPVVSKIKAVVGSNSRVINMAVGAAFRIIFKGATHVTGLGGAVLASAIYGGASKGIGEYRSARAELLGNQGWREEIDKLENPKQKLEIMRQMVANPAALRRYFAGNSSEAFEFFGQYQELLGNVGEQEAGEDQESEQSIQDIYSQKESSARKRAWRAAGKAAATAALYSAAGYGIAHFFSELLHPDTPEPQGDSAPEPQGNSVTEPAIENTKASLEGADPTAQGPSHVEIPITRITEHEHDMTWRWNGVPHQPRLEIDHSTHLFEVGDDEHARFAEVKVEGNGEMGDTGSTPEEVAKEIARSIGSGRSGESLGIGPQQEEEIQKHIANWLHENKSNDLQNGEFNAGTTLRVDASELNDALKSAGIERIDIDRYGMPGSDRPEVTRDARFEFSKEPETVGSEDGTLPHPPNMPQPNGPVVEASPEGKDIKLPGDDSGPATGEKASSSDSGAFPPDVADEIDLDTQRAEQNWKAIAKLGGASLVLLATAYKFRKPLKTAFGPIWEKGKKFFSKKDSETEEEKTGERAASNPDEEAPKEQPKPAEAPTTEEEKRFREELEEDEQKAFDAIVSVDTSSLRNDQVYFALERLSSREDAPISFISKMAEIVEYETYQRGEHIPAMDRIAANCYERLSNSPDTEESAVPRFMVICIMHSKHAAAQGNLSAGEYWKKVEKISRRYRDEEYSEYQDWVAAALFESLDSQNKHNEAKDFAIEAGRDGFGRYMPEKAKVYIEENERNNQEGI